MSLATHTRSLQGTLDMLIPSSSSPNWTASALQRVLRRMLAREAPSAERMPVGRALRDIRRQHAVKARAQEYATRILFGFHATTGSSWNQIREWLRRVAPPRQGA
jgi:hypothetical protein